MLKTEKDRPRTTLEPGMTQLWLVFRHFSLPNVVVAQILNTIGCVY
jgi:hypothetical protein